MSLARYHLEINRSSVRPDVLYFRGSEALSTPFSWRIEFTCPQPVAPEEVLMKYASLRMLNSKTVHGIITGFEWLSTSADQSHYCVVLESRLVLLARTRRCAIYQHQSVPDVVEQVLRAHGFEGPDIEFRLERSYPARELITQWRESDLQFIQRILAEVGMFWRTEMDNRRELETVIVADSQRHYQFDVPLPYREPNGLHGDESVWGVRTWHHAVTSKVSTRDYNYRTASTPLDAQVSVRSDAVTIGEHYRYAEPYREAGDDNEPAPETESGAFYARLHHERLLNTSARLHLFSNAAHVAPGQVLEPQGSSLSSLKNGMLITLATFRASRDSRLHVSLWGQPYSERYCYRPALLARPEVSGTLPARIESRQPQETYAWLDEQGRYRVKLDFDRDNPEQGYAYLWLRLAKPYAGANYGWHTPLVAGTEVAIAYGNGDIDLPYIAYALHDSAHADLVNRDNHSQNLLRTAGQNTLHMEDQRGKEHVHLGTEYGKSQLNSGHLVDEQGKKRGSGFELRTDEYGVLRVAKGLFITADGQTQAQGDVLDMETALNEIEKCLRQVQQLNAAAEQAQALKADIDSQIAAFEQRLTPLNALIHASATQGVAVTSGEHLQLAASQNVAVNAGGDISVGAMGNLTVQTGETLGLFSHTGALSLTASEGAVEIQAQNGNMQLYSKEKMTLSSVSDIVLAGKKRITLIGGGSYVTLEQGKIEYGTQAQYLRRIKRTVISGAAGMEVDFPSLCNEISNTPVTKKILFS